MLDLRYNGVSALCVVGAAFVAVSGHDGWGWLLFVAVLCYGGWRQSEDEPDSN